MAALPVAMDLSWSGGDQMKTYARLQDHRVMEIVTSNADIATLYHPTLTWMDVSAVPAIAVGWRYDGSTWSAPEPTPVSSASPSIAQLQSQVAYLASQLAELSNRR